MSENALITLLAATRQEGRAGVDLRALGLSRSDALALQLKVLERMCSLGETLVGWKVSYTSGGGRDRMGPGYRPFGFILGSRSLESGATVELAAALNMAVEPELCLELKQPLHGVVSRDEARVSVGVCYAAFELNEIRPVKGTDEATTLADGCGQWGIVVGAQATADAANTAIRVDLYNDERLVASSVPGDTMDDPYLSLARLSARLDEFGVGLEAGQRVITGSFSRAVIDAPGTWQADFEGIGHVAVSFK
jgi:2-keto-4-pentenoate hydratase